MFFMSNDGNEDFGQMTPVIPADLVPLYQQLAATYGVEQALTIIDQYGPAATQFLQPTTLRGLGQEESGGGFKLFSAETRGFVGELTGFILIGAILYLGVPILKDLFDSWRAKMKKDRGSVL